MLKVKAGELYLSQAALYELMGKDLPNRSAMLLRRVIKRVEPDIKVFDEQRLKVAAKYGKAAEDGNTYNIEKENIEKFNAELAELGEEEFSYEGLDQLVDLGNAEVKTATLIALNWLIPE